MDGGAWWAAVHGVAKSQTWLNDFTFIFHFHALEKEMATYSSILAWRIPGMGEPGGLLSMGSHRVGHDWSDLAAAAVYSCFSHLFVSNYLYLITHLPWWFLAFGSSFFCSASFLLKSLHFICQQPLMISKIPGVFLMSPSTSDEAPDLESQDPGDIKMGNEPMEASSPIQTVWVVLLNHFILQEKQLNIFATYFFLILFLSHTVLVMV